MPPMEPFPDATSLAFLEERYAEFLRDPDTVPESLRTWFERFGSDPDTAPRAPSFRPSSVFSPAGASGNGRAVADIVVLQDRVDQLVRAYRVRGHLLAELDPLRRPRPPCRELDSDYYGFRDSDLETRFSTNTIHGPENLTLAQIIERLRSTYCRRIGVQFMHIDDLHVKGWLTARHGGHGESDRAVEEAAAPDPAPADRRRDLRGVRSGRSSSARRASRSRARRA
jgi:2-oxoglutarate dehydrogenase E1 component